MRAGAPVAPIFFDISAVSDSLRENVEGFIVYLEADESTIDVRDVGQIDLVREAYVVRIVDVPPVESFSKFSVTTVIRKIFAVQIFSYTTDSANI